MNILADYFLMLLYVVDSTLVSKNLSVRNRFLVLKMKFGFIDHWKLRYEAIDQEDSPSLLRTFITGSVLNLKLIIVYFHNFLAKGPADPFESIPLLNEHDITIEYLENLENLMFQKYFKLASMIDPIIDDCFHIQIEHWNFSKTLQKVVKDFVCSNSIYASDFV